MSERDVLIASVKKNINVAGFMADMMSEILDPALTRVVAKTDNPFDDMAKAALYPVLEAELKKIIEEKLAELLK